MFDDKVNGRNNISDGISVLAINFIIKRVAKPVQIRSGLLIKLMAGTTFLMESMFLPLTLSSNVSPNLRFIFDGDESASIPVNNKSEVLLGSCPGKCTNKS